MVQALSVVQILTHVEQVEQLLDVHLILDGDGQLLTPDRTGETRTDKFRDLFKTSKLTRWQLDWWHGVVHVIEASFVFALLHDVLGEVHTWVFALNLKQIKLIKTTILAYTISLA